ncbi:MAG: 30S ribosomal protein S20 [Blastocatellia bacterium]|nr:30S ribosomal protein S20 [Blastocatellia bacterium]MCS7156960.1 30S ribosomal protein S20 [Blastocatellia bacterium]MDW8167653.1 30S ribosomal protein S20 [Acidobacteriota bacterium]MDW8256253.1 30S ribosomal protein S20 [Acidobacteriota bacterium]
MPRTKSAMKQLRKNLKRREINRRNLSRLRTYIKKLRRAIEAGDARAAQELLPQTISIIDKSIQKGVIHRNAAARYKSRLTIVVNRLAAKAQTSS